ncbi:MAG: DNA polymerase III subunit gamma/tau [Halanaerobium sp.]|nr:DNA polymerase III subunit gamma/tau [Halanaerobium sp.]
MAYLSLYRKWRPVNFADIAGQQVVVRTLTNAIKNNRIAHAYLFCGPRGTGKTSTAKVFAKSVNCEHGPTTEPCEECPSCRRINEGRSMDVIEIDAASNRGIDEIRDLREKVKFSPAEGKYKVYIVDEVHMLTKGAFNALLKTLEEPPEKVIFILATTEPHQLLPTILSRCQRFDFRLHGAEDIVDRLTYICQQEGIQADKEALYSIARTAEGSMRDAISLLDQVISYAGEGIAEEDVNTVMGKVDTGTLISFNRHLFAGDSPAVITRINQIIAGGKDISQLVKDLIYYYRNLLVIKECGPGKLVELPAELIRDLEKQAPMASVEQLMELVELFAGADQELKWSSNPSLTLEMAVLKGASLFSKEAGKREEQVRERIEEEKAGDGARKKTTGEEETKKGIAKDIDEEAEQVTGKEANAEDRKIGEIENSNNSTKGNGIEYKEEMEPVKEAGREKDETSSKGGQLAVEREGQDDGWPLVRDGWDEFLAYLNDNYDKKLHALIIEGRPAGLKGGTLYIQFPANRRFHKKNTQQHASEIGTAVKEKFGLEVRVTTIMEDETEAPADAGEEVHKEQAAAEENPLVKEALKLFNGKIVEEDE